MKLKEVKELSNKTNADLKKMLNDLHANIAKVKMDLKLGRDKNTGQLKEMKRDVARVMTVLNMKKGEEQVTNA
jgi:large subunit ribosomal protein L29